MAEGIYRSLVNVRDVELTAEERRMEAVGFCHTHPHYTGKAAPNSRCPACARVWNKAKMLAVKVPA